MKNRIKYERRYLPENSVEFEVPKKREGALEKGLAGIGFDFQKYKSGAPQPPNDYNKAAFQINWRLRDDTSLGALIWKTNQEWVYQELESGVTGAAPLSTNLSAILKVLQPLGSSLR